MKLVVVGGSPIDMGHLSGLMNRLEKSGFPHRMIIYAPNWKSCIEVLDIHPDTDVIFIPANSPIEYLKQIKRSARLTPLILTDQKTGDFKTMNLREAKGIIQYDNRQANPDENRISGFLQALNQNKNFLRPTPVSKQIQVPTTSAKRNRFLAKVASRLHPISIEQIAYFYSDNRLNFLTTWEGQRYVINHSMEELVRQLPSPDFFRISRSFIICYKCIDVIQVQDRNRLKILLNPSFKSDVFVSRDKVTEFKTWIGE
jgi:hypothetical protein